MQQLSALPALPLLLALTASPTPGQEDAGRPVLSDEAPRPAFVRATIGAEAVVLDDQGRLLGFVRDHVLSSATGRIGFLAVSSALTTEESSEAARLVPFERFAWNAEERGFVLAMTTAELEALPHLDPHDLPALGAGRAAAQHAKPSGAEAIEAALTRRDEPVLLSRLHGAPILGADAPLATVRELLLEPSRGRIAFALARVPADAEADDPRIIPWRAMLWEADEDGRGHLRIGLDAATFEEAPRLERAARAELGEPARRHAILRYYGLEPVEERERS